MLSLLVQCSAQQQLCKLAAILALLHLHCEVLISLQLVSLKRVAAHVCVFGASHGKASTRSCGFNDFKVDVPLKKTWDIVINVLEGHLDMEDVEQVLHQHLDLASSSKDSKISRKIFNGFLPLIYKPKTSS